MHQNEPCDKFMPVINDYITSVNGRQVSDYDVSLHRVDGSLRIYWVIHKGDRLEHSAGGHGDFEVHLDIKKNKVIKVLYFQ